MSSPGNQLVVRRTFLEYVGEEEEDGQSRDAGPRSRSEPAIPSFEGAETGFNQPEEIAEERSDADSEALGLLTDLPETLDGESSSKSATSTRLLVKNTFLEVVEDGEGVAQDYFQHRRHTAPVGVHSASPAQLREDRPSLEEQMLDCMLEHSDIRSQLSPRLSKKAAAQAANFSSFPCEEDAVLSERDPLNMAPVTQPVAEASELYSTDAVGLVPTMDSGSCSMSSGELTHGGTSASAGDNMEEGPKTTVMLRNLPVSFTRDMLLSVLDKEGFSGRYDFVYLPIDFGSRCGFGYAFINLVDVNVAAEFRVHFQGFSNWGVESSKVADITWSSTHQGFEEHVSRYRNSPVMHETMPDECKPIVLRDGVRIDFPPPTKVLRPPRIRPSKNRGGGRGGPSDSSQATAETDYS